MNVTSEALIPKIGYFVPIQTSAKLGRMAIEKSPYEGTFDKRLHSQTCLGRVIRVDVANRTCQVKTIGMKGATDDLDLYNVKWVSFTAHPDGEEEICIPRPGQHGVITFINSQPYITGYFKPTITLDAKPKTQSTQEALLNPGDRVISTYGKNKVAVLSGGTVQIESNDQCRTWWIPTKNRMSSVCGNYSLETNGGFTFWEKRDDDSTILRFYAYDQLEPENIIDLQIGYADDEESLVSLVTGKADSTSGEISDAKFSFTVNPDGDTLIQVGAVESVLDPTVKPMCKILIEGSTGNITLETKGDLTANVEGDADLVVEGDLSTEVKGDMSAVVEGDVTQEVKGDVDQTVEGDITSEASGDLTAKAAGGASLKLSSGKVALGSSSAELCDIIDQLLQAIQVLTVPTVMGPSSVPINAAQFASLQSKLATIKGSL